MSDKLIKDFDTLTDPQVNDDSKLMPFGRASDGKLFQGTVAQAKKVFSSKKYRYVALGSEGTTLTIGTIAGMEILQISRNGQILDDNTGGSLDTTQFSWDNTNITLGLGVTMAGEKFLILYKYP